MQYKAKTPTEYLVNLEPDWRKAKLNQIRDLILKYSSDLKEDIEYKMLAYSKNDKPIFHLNAQKNYVSLYVGTIKKVENGEELLKDFDLGKGCIRIKKSINISETQLEAFIKKTIQFWNQGDNTDC